MGNKIVVPAKFLIDEIIGQSFGISSENFAVIYDKSTKSQSKAKQSLLCSTATKSSLLNNMMMLPK